MQAQRVLRHQQIYLRKHIQGRGETKIRECFSFSPCKHLTAKGEGTTTFPRHSELQADHIFLLSKLE